jgi:hypothetical protein
MTGIKYVKTANRTCPMSHVQITIGLAIKLDDKEPV